MGYIIALALLALLQTVLSIVLSYKKHSIVSKVFMQFSIALVAWTLANSLLTYALQFPDSFSGIRDRLELLNWANHLGFATGTLTLTMLYRLTLVFPIVKTKSRKSKLLMLAGFMLALVALHPVVSGFYSLENLKDIPEYNYGSLRLLVTVYYLVVAVATIVTLIKTLRTSKSHITKVQAKTTLIALLATASVGALVILVMPVITGDDSFIVLGYFSPFIFTAATFYSISRQGLLDFQAVIARSFAYLLSISALGLIYGFVAFNLINHLLFSDANVTAWQRTVYTLLAVIIAFTFQPLKRFFDKWSNRFFYQDAYDGQALIDELNQKLVSTIELDKMLQSSSEILERNIKPEFCVFGLKETDHEEQRIIGNAHKKFGYQDISFAKMALPQMNQKVIVADYLEESHKELQAKMRKNDVAVLVRLTTDVGVEGLGAIALGAKKSGNAYNSQDIKVLEIVANSLVIAIDNALRFEEIQKFNITLEQKVEDATRKLRRANEKLIALDQTKDDFISMASHQLRTPLTSVKGYLSMVLDGDVGKVTPKQAKLLEQAFSSSQRMVYLIADLLNISRLRTGKFVIELKPTNLAEVIEGEVGQLKATASGKNQRLTYNKPKTFPTYMLDETKIRQVIMNFTDNALHYTQAGGHIQVALKETSSTIEFTVTDNGIGIPRHEQHHLFTKFFRAGNAKKARPDGTGLGLFMAKKVIIAQGGSVIFRSQEGKGSTFGFSFAKSRLKVHESSADKPAATAQSQLARSQPAAAAKTPVKVR